MYKSLLLIFIFLYGFVVDLTAQVQDLVDSFGVPCGTKVVLEIPV